MNKDEKTPTLATQAEPAEPKTTTIELSDESLEQIDGGKTAFNGSRSNIKTN